MSIRIRYEKELKDVFDNFILMCRYIESAMEKCAKALEHRDIELAHEVFEDDKRIDKLEREIERSCLRLLLMEHPVANDFHEVAAALKMITDLERIGDQIRNIADITIQFESGEIKRIDYIMQMVVIVIQMVKDGIDAYISRDLDLARSLDKTDDKVDMLFDAAMKELGSLMKENPNSAKEVIMFMMIAKYLERIGDHAVNIGEWVEYAITGNHAKKEEL